MMWKCPWRGPVLARRTKNDALHNTSNNKTSKRMKLCDSSRTHLLNSATTLDLNVEQDLCSVTNLFLGALNKVWWLERQSPPPYLPLYQGPTPLKSMPTASAVVVGLACRATTVTRGSNEMQWPPSPYSGVQSVFPLCLSTNLLGCLAALHFGPLPFSAWSR